MKKLLIILLIFNCYFTDAQMIGIISNQQSNKIISVPESENSNQPEETAYFNAYLLPLSQKSQLQNALDTYGAVRLEKGDYSGVNITINSNQKLYGHPEHPNTGEITIQAGSSGIVLDNIKPYQVTFQAGSPITDNNFNNIKFSSFVSNNAQIENNTFLNVDRSPINWNSSSSGYFRNNKIIKYWTHSGSNKHLTLKGNISTPSYGNVWLWSNILTPFSDATDIDTVEDLTMVGIDSEGWNLLLEGEQALLHMRNMGDVKLAGLTGGAYNDGVSPVFDIEASYLTLYDKEISSNNGGDSSVQPNTNTFIVHGNYDDYDFNGTGFNFKAHYNNNNVYYNGSNQTSTISNPTTISNLTDILLRPQKNPWEKPIFNILPNPTGTNWSSNRIGQDDDHDYLQGLIDSNTQIPEGIYYINSTLHIASGSLLGSGTGKTAIVGLKDDFPLVTFSDTNSGVMSFTLANVTLQGGSVGLLIKAPTLGQKLMISGATFKYVVFRNQDYGVHLDRIYGFDNNFVDNVSFIDCNIGFLQSPDPSYSGGETNVMSYVDKTLFYKSQVINCNIGFSMIAKRANNLNAWVDCKFDNNESAAIISGNLSPLFANCEFKNHSGTSVISGNNHNMGIYSCVFSNNSTTNLLDLQQASIEGSQFLDTIDLFKNTYTRAYIINSTVTGNVGGINTGMIINSNMKSNPNLNKLLVNIVSGTVTTLIDEEPDPYPQLLVKH